MLHSSYYKEQRCECSLGTRWELGEGTQEDILEGKYDPTREVSHQMSRARGEKSCLCKRAALSGVVSVCV